MAGQGIWSGTISFSLVAIPVRLVRAVNPEKVSFRLLHAEDHAPLNRRMYCPEEDALIDPREIVRGFELPTGDYVKITGEELESVSPERSRTIEIMEFVDTDEIDPIHFDRPYYLVPLKGGEKAYRLLALALQSKGKAGLARFVLAEREHLVSVTGREGALILTTLHYSHEIIAPEPAQPLGKVDRDRVEAMKAAILGLAGEFDPSRYPDERLRKIKALLEERAHEAVAVETQAEEELEGPPDLMAALEEVMRQMETEH